MTKFPATPSATELKDRLIVALDFASAGSALDLVDRLEGRCSWFKVGLELYFAAGPGIVDRLRERGFLVFLDLKLHDIPNTVAAGVRSLSSCGASLLTLHAAGGPDMLKAAAEAAAHDSNGPRLLAVTVLTSMDARQLGEVGMVADPAAQVLRLARLARTAGIPGVVCSPQEVSLLRTESGENPLLVVPGIRPAGTEPGDQRRVATPASALAAGASMLVIGRPITQSPDPAGAVDAIYAEMATAHLDREGR